MYCDDSHRTLFPTMPGEPISYLPMKISEESAMALYKKLGYGTIHELMIAYHYKTKTDDEFFIDISVAIEPQDHEVMNKVTCLELFNGNGIIMHYTDATHQASSSKAGN